MENKNIKNILNSIKNKKENPKTFEKQKLPLALRMVDNNKTMFEKEQDVINKVFDTKPRLNVDNEKYYQEVEHDSIKYDLKQKDNHGNSDKPKLGTI